MANVSKFRIKHLGTCRYDSPISDIALGRTRTPRFVDDTDRVLQDDRVPQLDSPEEGGQLNALELAGPRRRCFFDPATARVGIVNCGGLCPGLNDVIRGLVMEAYHRYGIRQIHGFRYGYRGLIAGHEHAAMALTPDVVSYIHQHGGSILSSSRGAQDVSRIVDNLEQMSISILFTIGGDGTLRGALEICNEIERRGLNIAVVGIPKTIDNDIQYIDQSFGFDTAYSQAVDAIVCAHNEAKGTLNGVGLVKVMGRHSGCLACHATLATSHVNFVLIPEMPLVDDSGPKFMEMLRQRLEKRHHAVVLVAEGALQDRLQTTQADTDASGNIKLADVGQFVASRIAAYLDSQHMEYSIKYIDPSYMIRSVPASPADSMYCWQLAQNAVHAAMAGKTELIVGKWHGRIVHVPIQQAISQRKTVDTEGDLWLSVLEATGQPAVFE